MVPVFNKETSVENKDVKQPLVSIALCTFNGTAYLTGLLDSLLEQTYPNTEIIAVDDCSTDQTFQILQAYRNEHPKTVHIHRNTANLGFSKNFEKAISLCTGTYIALCDQDDIWVKNKIEILVNNIGNHTLIYHDSRFIDQDGRDLEKNLSDTTQMYTGKSNYFFLRGNTVSGHAMLFKSSLKRYIFPFDGRFYHDWWIAFVASSVGEIKYLDMPLVYHRRHNRGITSGSGQDKELPMAQVHRSKLLDFNLEWIIYLGQFKYAKNRKELSFIATTLQNFAEGKKGWRFFYFLYKYFPALMSMPKRKNFLSRFNLTRKLYAKS